MESECHIPPWSCSWWNYITPLNPQHSGLINQNSTSIPIFQNLSSALVQHPSFPQKKKFESYNGIMRNASTHSNDQLPPGRDITIKFINYHFLHLFLSGGTCYRIPVPLYEALSMWHCADHYRQKIHGMFFKISHSRRPLMRFEQKIGEIFWTLYQSMILHE